MKDPAFLFYSNDFLSGTMLMSNEEVGKYIRLLCIQHQQGYLTNEDMTDMKATKKILNKFKQNEDGNYYNERLKYEANRRKNYTESRRNNLKNAHMGSHMETHMDKHMENENINKNINENEIKNNRKKGSKGKKEEEKIHFAEFVTMTNTEYEKLLSAYGKDFVDQCITILDNYKGSKRKNLQE